MTKREYKELIRDIARDMVKREYNYEELVIKMGQLEEELAKYRNLFEEQHELLAEIAKRGVATPEMWLRLSDAVKSGATIA